MPVESHLEYPVDQDAIEYLNKCLDLENQFERPPKVSLKLVSQTLPGQEPMGTVDVATTTATQCYSPGRATFKPRLEAKSHDLARKTLDGGHQTTRQHFHCTCLMDDVTRQAIHDVFHSFPYYNTEQQSQRYAAIEIGGFYTPTCLTEQQQVFYMDCAMFANRTFSELNQLIAGDVDLRMRKVYPATAWENGNRKEALTTKREKLIQEIGRYMLPIAQFSTFDYTINELELLRLFRTSQQVGTSDETRYVLAKMVKELIDYDPTFIEELRKPLERNTDTYFPEITERFATASYGFDQQFKNGSNTQIQPGYTRERLVRIARGFFGLSADQISDSDLIKRVLDPKSNKLLADVYEPGINDRATSLLRLVNVEFDTRLSHTADSQRQRHRETPGSTPILVDVYQGKADFMTPMVIRENPELLEKYSQMMGVLFDKVNRCIDAGIPKEIAVMLLPNAFTLRVSENGNLLSWFHRFKQRSCFRAQEEFSLLTFDQMGQMLNVLPEAKEILQAPCGVRKRAGITSYCPEGEGFCGVTVFNRPLDEYKRLRII